MPRTIAGRSISIVQSHESAAPAPLAVIAGTNGEDTLEGTGSADTIDGRGGDDALYGWEGNDSLIGGLGYDWALDGGTGNDTLNGGSGLDVAQFDFYSETNSGVDFSAAAVTGFGGTIVVNAGVLGIDTLIGVEDVTIYGTVYNDRLTGGGGFDYLYGDSGADTLTGGDGDDTLNGGAGADALFGGNGYDSAEYDFYADSGAVNFSAAALAGDGAAATIGADRLSGIEAALIYGSAVFSDKLSGGGGDDVIYGYGGFDLLRGGTGNDYLWGGGDDDTLAAGAGDDQLEGDSGDDELDGAGGYDTAVYSFADSTFGIGFSAAAIDASATVQLADGLGGTDTLSRIEAASITGSAYNDSLSGSNGDDLLTGGTGDDTLAGGAGWDNAVFDFYGARHGVVFNAAAVAPKSTVVVNAGMLGFDTLTGVEALMVYASDYNDNLTGGPGGDYIQCFSGNDTVNGGPGADVVYGEEGQDQLNGGTGADWLYSGSANDVLNGGSGNDYLSGGPGADRFSFTIAPDAQSNQDTIDTFQHGVDRLQLDNAVFGGIGGIGARMTAAAFVQGTAAIDSGDRIIYDSANGDLYFDADGTGSAVPILFALLEPGSVLTAADIWVI